MLQKKLFLAAVTSLILSLIVLSEVSNLLLNIPAELLEESYDEKQIDESDDQSKKLLSFASLDGFLVGSNGLILSQRFQYREEKGLSPIIRSSTPPLFILYCSLKIDFC